MSRPKKKKLQYLIREDVVKDMKNNPNKYKKHEPKFDISKFTSSQKMLDLVNDFKQNKILQACLDLTCSTGISLHVIIPRIIGAELDPLNLNLSREQLNILLPYFNKYVLQDAITIDNFEKLMKGEISNSQYYIKKNRSLAVFFSELSNQGFITTKWQDVLGRIKIFYSNRGKLLKASDFSKTLSFNKKTNKIMRKELIEIKSLIEKVKEIR